MAKRPVLLAFDGSPAAEAAIADAGRLLGPRAATVLSVWTSLLQAAPVAGGIPAYLADLDPRLEEEARAAAEKGLGLARDAGFDAETLVVRATAAWEGILEAAEAVDAEVIVVGARGLSALKSVLVGSTSSGVLHHTKRPVLVIHGSNPEEGI